MVSCPSHVKLIGSKWVFSVKLRPDRSVDRYKARLVALGNRQEYGVDYEETFAPVAKMTIVCTIIAIAASQGWSLCQMAVKNAFLHSDLQENVYMTPPPGLCSSSTSNVFYVDDIVITGTDSALIDQLKQHLHDLFHVKDLGSLRYFLSLEVQSDSSGVFLHQHKYTEDLISLSGWQDSSSVGTPLEVNVKYRREEGDLLPDPMVFRQLVGSLNYLTITWPDISFVVQQVSQFLQSPRHLHLAAVLRIIRYLRGPSHRGLFFSTGTPLRLMAFSDADWAGCPDTRRSVTEWYMFLGDSLISWKKQKQKQMGLQVGHCMFGGSFCVLVLG
ncbi:uncharacterized mitochondrial protein AtMg00810-like [Magnolia sinica]|uniref:uncharacterized mitochondrial protein AtMg00810-like n=1 Tax=Magnolia sinica TaxID=86752 RepID=UPI002659B717|nr:uncharacterized mitochondrial protein AtMg00810-like [Magnolia sinica]